MFFWIFVLVGALAGAIVAGMGLAANTLLSVAVGAFIGIVVWLIAFAFMCFVLVKVFSK